MAPTSTSEGYITLAVLLIVGLLAAIVSSLLAVSRPALGLSRIGGDEVAVGALVEGGLTAAAFLLYGAQREADSVDGLALHMRTGEVIIAVADEGGRIDVNSVDPLLLEGLFEAVGGESLSPQAFAARIADWRDEDEDVNEDGAEAGEYAEAGLAYSPANLPFHSVEELRFLLGLSRSDFDRLAPFLTVFSGSDRIDPLSAPEPVLRAIPGMGAREMRQLLQARRNNEDRERIAELMPDVSEFFLDQSSGVYRIGVQVRLTDGFSEAVEAVITATRKDSADFRVVAWSRLAPAARPQ